MDGLKRTQKGGEVTISQRTSRFTLPDRDLFIITEEERIESGGCHLVTSNNAQVDGVSIRSPLTQGIPKTDHVDNQCKHYDQYASRALR